MTTPTISTHSGTPSSGNTITLTTTNAMNEDRSTWLPALTASSAALYLHNNGTAGNWSDGTFQMDHDPTIKLIGPNSMTGTWSGASTSSNLAGIETWQQIPSSWNTGYIWWRGYHRSLTTGAWPSSFHKLYWSGAPTTNPAFLDFDVPSNPSNSMEWVYDGSLNTDAANDFPFGGWQDERWHLVEWGLPAGSGTQTAYIYVDNVLIDSRSMGGNVSGSNAYWALHSNCRGTSSGFSQTWWDSGVTWNHGTQTVWSPGGASIGRVGPACLIELADSATYASANKRYQFPESVLSETSVGFIYDETGLSGSDRYVFITNNLGERSTGYLISGSGGGGDPVYRGRSMSLR